MTQFTSDFIVAVSAIGGIVGVIFTTAGVVKGRAKYIEQSQCNDIHNDTKKQLEKEEQKRSVEVEKIYKKISDEVEKLHEKSNQISNRVSKIEGGLKL